MKSNSRKPLSRRIEALRRTFTKSVPDNQDRLLQVAVKAMVSAWTREELEEVLKASERNTGYVLPRDLRIRWVTRLDKITLERFGKTFGSLLEAAQEGIGRRSSAVDEHQRIKVKERIPHAGAH